MTRRVLFIVGSFRKDSLNAQLAKLVAKVIGERAEISYLQFDELPFFHQDLEEPVLPEVARVRQAVEEADVLWIFSPVYNHAIPGSVKNLLDWLSRSLDLSDTRGPSVLFEKLVTVSSVSKGKGAYQYVFEDYQKLLSFIRMEVIEPFTGISVSTESYEAITQAMSARYSLLEEQIATLLAVIDEKKKG
ncbi:NADPH-dependent FMN reductase [Streptococcus sp. zg-JUN1979]|uniref:NADPH-dependent FMN reductase n=1 Tax=Streptococcus sp. zg-JUN1979 TaxID=3391450 RepID=UPI0039A5FA5B